MPLHPCRTHQCECVPPPVAGQETLRATPFLIQQAAAARSPEERSALWSTVGSLSAAAERLLRLLPKLPSSSNQTAAMSPASIQTEAALVLSRAARDAAFQLSGVALRQRLDMPSEVAATAAVSVQLAALARTLSKCARMWAEAPVEPGAEAAVARRRQVAPRYRLTAAQADHEGRILALQLLEQLFACTAYSLRIAVRAEGADDAFMAEYG